MAGEEIIPRRAVTAHRWLTLVTTQGHHRIVDRGGRLRYNPGDPPAGSPHGLKQIIGSLR